MENDNRPKLTGIAFAVSLSMLASPGMAQANLIGTTPNAAGTDTLLLDIGTSPFSVSTIGGLGVLAGSGMDVEPGTGVVYCSTGRVDGGRLLTINPGTGNATLVGDIVGAAAVPGLAFDLDGTLFATAAPSMGPSNRLISINPVTAALTHIGFFGGGVCGLDSLAVHPTTGVLYSLSGTCFDGSPGDLFTINKATGQATRIGEITQQSTGLPPPFTVAGMAFDTAGNLYASLGNGDGRILSVNLAAMTFVVLGSASNLSVPALAIKPGTQGPGTPFCFGSPCPCGNDSATTGCVNSTGSGALLDGSGSASVAADDLVLTTTGCPPNNTGLYFMGGVTLAPVVVGDGLACTGGLFRYFPSVVDASGTFVQGTPVASAFPGAINPGDTRHFQAWTRDVLCGPPPAPCPSPCGMNSNLSNGYSVTFTP